MGLDEATFRTECFGGNGTVRMVTVWPADDGDGSTQLEINRRLRLVPLRRGVSSSSRSHACAVDDPEALLGGSGGWTRPCRAHRSGNDEGLAGRRFGGGASGGTRTPTGRWAHWDLNPARLPIPPRSRDCETYR
jgi:hypothetical protein